MQLKYYFSDKMETEFEQFILSVRPKLSSDKFYFVRQFDKNYDARTNFCPFDDSTLRWHMFMD